MPASGPQNTIRLLIADDTAEFRRSVRMMISLERDLEVVAIARDGQEAVELAQRLQPDVAVMDINMPRVDGLTAIRAMAKVSPGTVCMIMSSEGERDQLRQAMAAGVREYLLKPFTTDEFVAAVRRVAGQALEARQKAAAARQAETERDRYLLQLTLAYLKTGRMDDEAAKAYAEYALRPSVDPNLLARLAEIFCARRDWRILRMICERMERLTAPPAPPHPPPAS
jgi:YesN/AraC family two-component response regulator